MDTKTILYQDYTNIGKNSRQSVFQTNYLTKFKSHFTSSIAQFKASKSKIEVEHLKFKIQKNIYGQKF